LPRPGGGRRARREAGEYAGQRRRRPAADELRRSHRPEDSDRPGEAAKAGHAAQPHLQARKGDRLMTVYDFEARTLDGRPASLADWRGQALLIVNTASKCGFTPQYAGLDRLHRTYKERGFSVIGFPCNQFGAQEPGSADEIANFCSLTYDVSFPMMAKIEVNGPGAHPLYAYLKHARK